ncbi:VOC family protein [Robertkochia aurantiaca]|uniref:VOC family protein n=1 Tax=Robertkochia aurantiaca TaxID=2873700 RepID=UPI001CCE4BA1|nr:VOC family protein [Robertkochia sp. 3YJGBD-33]
MKLQQLTPNLYTREIEKTIEFYVNNLGFNCTDYHKDLGWAMLEREGVSIMLSLPNDHLPFDKPAFTGSFYFYMEGVHKYWEAVKDEVEVAYPLESFDYGMTEFAIYDNNGYMLQFGEAAE